MAKINRFQNRCTIPRNNKLRYYFYIIVILLVITLLYTAMETSAINFIFGLKRSSMIDDSICLLKGGNWVVVTTTSYPTPAIHRFISLTSWNLIVIADRKTPKDWLQHLTVNSTQLLFVSLEQQYNLDFRILRYLPEGSYARKNLGYLIAIKCGAQIIFESDDDNLLETPDILLLPKVAQPEHVPWIAFHRQRSPFVNIYGSFGHPQIWPRGFPIDEIRNVTEDGWHSVRRNRDNDTHAYIQQYLADLDPDVDAIYRLAHPLSIGRIHFDRDQPPIALEPFTFSPYNTQNTVTYYEAFWGLYLPVTTTFRVCDIWRGYWVQRLLWDIGGRLIFGRPTVSQVHTNHLSFENTAEEDMLHRYSGSFVRFLASWTSTKATLNERIAELARDVAKAGFWKPKEADIMDAWLADLQSVGYSFPSVVSLSPSSAAPVKQRRAAVCVTGLTECVQEAWGPTHKTILQHVSDDIDTFLLLSSSFKGGSVPLNTRLKQARSYMNSTVTILYEDRDIDPHIPPDCKIFHTPVVDMSREIYYYQQLWALSECFDFVKDHEQRMNIRYDLFVRSRADSVLNGVVEPLVPPNSSTIIIPDDNHWFGYNDRFAVGSIAVMEKYMKRWDSLGSCQVLNRHPESFLKLSLDQLSIPVQPVKNVTFDQQPHAKDSCH